MLRSLILLKTSDIVSLQKTTYHKQIKTKANVEAIRKTIFQIVINTFAYLFQTTNSDPWTLRDIKIYLPCPNWN